ncbi:hypothetical protein RZS08_61720, partial [Arthrospira platensis SPKY1]|nr:hypothetical protein [Arthrospira platensis SPKY1]
MCHRGTGCVVHHLGDVMHLLEGDGVDAPHQGQPAGRAQMRGQRQDRRCRPLAAGAQAAEAGRRVGDGGGWLE